MSATKKPHRISEYERGLAEGNMALVSAKRAAQAALAMEKVKGAIRTLDMANSWEAYSRGTASGHAERMRLQLDLMGRALKQDRIPAETARINAGSFKHAEGVWNVLQRAIEGQTEAFGACLKAMEEAFELIGREEAWKEIRSFAMSFGFDGQQGHMKLWEPTMIISQLRGEGFWKNDYDPLKGWVPRWQPPAQPSSPAAPEPPESQTGVRPHQMDRDSAGVRPHERVR
jgi:hypothetical protein